MREYFILLSTDSKYLKPPQWVGRLISEEVMGNESTGIGGILGGHIGKFVDQWQYIHHLIKWESSPMLGMWQGSPFPCCHMQGSIEGTLCLFITLLEETLKSNIPFTERPFQCVSSGNKEAEALGSWWSLQEDLSAARAPAPAQFLTHALSFQQQCFLGFCPWYLRFIFLLKWNTVPYNRAIYLPLKIFEQQNGIKTALASVGYNDFLPTEG